MLKRGQERKCKIFIADNDKRSYPKGTRTLSRRGQEEIVGFAVIMILVAVILLIFLGFYLNNPVKETVESYEVDNFLQAALGYTTDCGNYRNDHLELEDLIFECVDSESCLDGRDSCDVLKEVFKDLVDESWKTGEEWPYKGYELNVMDGNMNVLNLEKGNTTLSYRSASRSLRSDVEVIFSVYT